MLKRFGFKTLALTAALAIGVPAVSMARDTNGGRDRGRVTESRERVVRRDPVREVHVDRDRDRRFGIGVGVYTPPPPVTGYYDQFGVWHPYGYYDQFGARRAH